MRLRRQKPAQLGSWRVLEDSSGTRFMYKLKTYEDWKRACDKSLLKSLARRKHARPRKKLWCKIGLHDWRYKSWPPSEMAGGWTSRRCLRCARR